MIARIEQCKQGSVEQMVRDILEQAVKDGLVVPVDGRDPQEMTAGDLVGLANLLNECLAGRKG